MAYQPRFADITSTPAAPDQTSDIDEMSIYTDEQIQLYFERIGLPADNIQERRASDPLGFLTTLKYHHIAAIPFDSLALHYSPHRLLSLSYDDLFTKLVTRRHGGYCMEVNAFLAAVLRTLGYTLYTAGARVNVQGAWGGWAHEMTIVTIDDTRYLVDVGFGFSSPAHPVPLKDNREFTTIAPARGKLEYRALSIHTDPSQRMWVYSAQRSANAPWEEMYSFPEMEFFPADFQVMNLSTMTSPQSFFVQNVLCLKVLLGEETGKPEGLLFLHRDLVKRQVGGEVEILQTLESEEDRLQALEKWFGIVFSEAEKLGIRGLASELKRRPPQGDGHA